MKEKQKSFEVKIRIPFFDLDPMQIVWHANYLNYFEIARAALFENNGIDLYSFFEKQQLIFPIIKTSTKHVLPLRHNDEIICKATLVDAYVKLIVDFEIRKMTDGKLCARGRTEQVAVKVPEMEMLFSMPDEIRRAFGFLEMEDGLKKSFIAGLERLIARADLLDSINVFPVADGDTGRNLSISLIPLRNIGQPKEKIIHQLLLSARGNSGNIASQFFSAFCTAENIPELAQRSKDGAAKAWQAVSNPRVGTMLSVFDALVEALLYDLKPDRETVEKIIGSLEKAVHETCEQLPRLQEAGVVDAGALGMYVFFEGFFYALAGILDECRPVTETFKNRLKISSSFQENKESGYCVDFVVKAPRYSPDEIKMITSVQEEVIIIPEGDFYKVHLHTQDKEQVRSQITGLGSLVNWEDDNLAFQVQEFMDSKDGKKFHIMTDAAGSLTINDAKIYGFTLLNSYLTIGEQSLPETYFSPEELYRAMKNEVKVSTSQASVYERHQFYQSALERFEKVLYLCVGSAFTGNYHAALQWKQINDKEDRFIILDTGAASGRLGTIALATARYLDETNDMKDTVIFARKAIRTCEEYVFLDKLQYLAAGGRLSKTSAFFGDKLNMKPVISPLPEGVKKVGTLRNQEEQIEFALSKLDESIEDDSQALIMLEYSDNKNWVNGTVKKELEEFYPNAEIILQPLSLTSGAHMGPGTWGVAFLPEQYRAACNLPPCRW